MIPIVSLSYLACAGDECVIIDVSKDVERKKTRQYLGCLADQP
jgi:hypothetical protein